MKTSGAWLLASALTLFLFSFSSASAEVLSTSDDGLPSYWYAGDIGKKPTVKDQGSYGTCWAITATSALEAALLPSLQMVFSADHLSLQNAFTVDVNDGGDYLMLMAYLCGWQGPVTEEQDPYGDEYSPKGLSAAVHVQEVRVILDSSIEKIKETVYTYGSVQTSLYMDHDTASDGAGYYNTSTSSYYYTEEMTQNHDVLILGWDDFWPAGQFASRPDQDGAFICLNTWGSDFGEDGIFYVSYSDPNIGSVAVAYTRIEDTDNYDHLYQYDPCGWQGQQGYESEYCYFANVYTAEGEELLSAVGFYATGEDTSYEIYLVHDFDGADSFDQMEYLQSGSFEDMGYYTVDLNTEQELAAGERFAVVVRIHVPDETNPVAVEYRSDEYTQNVTTEGKESYLSRYGVTWENTQEQFETNVCLKVYTSDR
ncbi:MAG: lectin like domain-containing protein [Lachnospiraceae bacterium]|nr:lectin like domain-containing protein [Lachnospiraceae bacterium]MCD7765661.1 lectin like domain-containing protein [Lachnospiraceae bacterium]